MRISITQRITVLALIGFGLLNPFSVEVLDYYFKWAYTIVFVLCAVWLVGFLLYKALKPERTHIPKKSAKTQKAGKLIAT